MVIVAPGY